MFGIGLPELIVIMAVALIVVGPDKLPELARGLAKQFFELKKAANVLKDSLQEEESFSGKTPVSQDAPMGFSRPEQLAAAALASQQREPIEAETPRTEVGDLVDAAPRPEPVIAAPSETKVIAGEVVEVSRNTEPLPTGEQPGKADA